MRLAAGWGSGCWPGYRAGWCSPRQLERATALLRRVGGRAVFVGRFTAALRALVPGLAGTAGMPYRTFLAWNLAGGVLWAAGFVLLGFAAGPAWRTAERIAGRVGLVLLGAIVAGPPRPRWSTGGVPVAAAGPHPK
jgi:membrane-associated protein